MSENNNRIVKWLDTYLKAMLIKKLTDLKKYAEDTEFQEIFDKLIFIIKNKELFQIDVFN